MNSSLTARESERLRICTEAVLDGLQKSFDAGIALIEIRESKLYREKFDTFEAFCEDVFSISRRRAYQLIDAAKIKESLPAPVAKLIVNESQARALSSVPEQHRVEVVNSASKSGPLTGRSIDKMCTIVHKDQPINTGKTEKPLPLERLKDREGHYIPQKALIYWNRRQEIQDMLTSISRIKGTIKKAQEDDDIMYRRLSYSVLINELSNAYTSINTAMPYAVCTTCQGLVPDKCSLCKGKGMISQFLWETSVPKEIKEMRRLSTERQK